MRTCVLGITMGLFLCIGACGDGAEGGPLPMVIEPSTAGDGAPGGGSGAGLMSMMGGGAGLQPVGLEPGTKPEVDAGTPVVTADSGAAGTPGSMADSGSVADSQTPATDAAVDNVPTTGPFPSIDDFTQPGSFTPTTVTGTGPAGGYTVYHPAELAPGGAKNPIVGWMSGGGTIHTAYPLLPLLASHGFFVVAPDVIPGIGQEAMLGQQIMDGIDWAIAEAEREGSPFFEKLDATKLASVGYSMGSLSTFMIADDPRLTTTVHISGGNMDTSRVQNLHAPAAFICGATGGAGCSILSTDCDIAAVNCDTDFEAATTPVFYAKFPAGHLGILTSPHRERIEGMTAAWLRYQLMGDTTLTQLFLADDCSYCNDANWNVQRKNF